MNLSPNRQVVSASGQLLSPKRPRRTVRASSTGPQGQGDNMKRIATLAALAAALAATSGYAQQGVTKDEIVLGTIQDLSGPIAGYGKQARNGMLLRVEEANEQGGLYGRKIKLLVEDSSYDPKKAILAAQKLVNQDQIF